jgi:hypothetical protein
MQSPRGLEQGWQVSGSEGAAVLVLPAAATSARVVSARRPGVLRSHADE